MPQHPYRPAPNPRRRGVCACGQPEDAHPAVPVEATRCQEWEREMTAAALAGYMDPEPLVAYAEARILPGPLKDFGGRDWVREALDELSDCRNYLVWWEQADLDEPESDEVDARRQIRVQALQHVAAAFMLIEQARRLSD